MGGGVCKFGVPPTQPYVNPNIQREGNNRQQGPRIFNIASDNEDAAMDLQHQAAANVEYAEQERRQKLEAMASMARVHLNSVERDTKPK